MLFCCLYVPLSPPFSKNEKLPQFFIHYCKNQKHYILCYSINDRTLMVGGTKGPSDIFVILLGSEKNEILLRYYRCVLVTFLMLERGLQLASVSKAYLLIL